MTPKYDLDSLVPSKRLAELVKESYATIDHWSSVGLLVFVRRGRRRLYHPDLNAARCERIRQLQQEGMSLATMRTVFANEESAGVLRSVNRDGSGR